MQRQTYHNGFELMLCMFLAGCYAIFFANLSVYDFANYHYYKGSVFWHPRWQQDISAAGLQTYFYGLLDGVTYELYQRVPAYWGKFITGAVDGIPFFIAWKILSALLIPKKLPHRIVYLSLSMMLNIVAMHAVTQLGQWRGDPVASIFVLSAAYIMLKAVKQLKDLRFPCCWAAGLLGVAVGLKLTQSYTVIAFILLVLGLGRPWKEKLVALSIAAASFIIMFLITYGYWGWVLYSHFGNPFFPMLNNVFQSPYALPHSYRGDTSFLPHSFIDIVLPMFRYLRGPAGHSLMIPMSIAFALTVINALLKKGRKSNEKQSYHYAVMIFFWGGFYAWSWQFSILRYLFPWQLLTGSVLAWLVIELPLSNTLKVFLYTLVTGVILTSLSFAGDLRGQFQLNPGYQNISLTHVKVPALPKNALVLKADMVDASIIEPFFDRNVRMISINQRGDFRLNDSTLLAQQAQQAILQEHAALYFIDWAGPMRKESEQSLRHSGLTVNLGSCHIFSIKLQHPISYKLCEVSQEADAS